jgi:exopolyphosphatase/guanosine-5'-triphosphate,3'-diphosphate pyrophosphatase
MRVATIDIGTNTVLLLVAETALDGSLHAVAERATITRLGEGVDHSRTLSRSAVERTRACLESYAKVVRELEVGRVAVVGTSAMRDAQGAEDLRVAVRALFGVEVTVLSGVEEARLTFAGGLDGLGLEATADTALFDIGGGSTEVVLGRLGKRQPAMSYVQSFDVGSVRLTERHVFNDPPTEAELAVLAGSAADAFAAVPPLVAHAIPVGVAGTMTTLAAVALRVAPYAGARVHAVVLPTERLRQVVRDLAVLDLRSRRAVPGMEPNRADVILAGGYIALALLDHWRAVAVRISDRGLRWGLAHELIHSLRAETTAFSREVPCPLGDKKS